MSALNQSEEHVDVEAGGRQRVDYAKNGYLGDYFVKVPIQSCLTIWIQHLRIKGGPF